MFVEVTLPSIDESNHCLFAWCVVAANVILGKLHLQYHWCCSWCFCKAYEKRLLPFHHFPIFFPRLTSYQWVLLLIPSIPIALYASPTPFIYPLQWYRWWNNTLTRKTNFKRKSIDKVKKRRKQHWTLNHHRIRWERAHTHFTFHITFRIYRIGKKWKAAATTTMMKTKNNINIVMPWRWSSGKTEERMETSCNLILRQFEPNFKIGEHKKKPDKNEVQTNAKFCLKWNCRFLSLTHAMLLYVFELKWT